jgi:hypothetical protein
MMCPWYKNLFDSGDVLALHIGMRFSAIDREFCKKLKTGLEFMNNHEAPYLIHCEAGIDRTGYLSLILESFMGAKFDDIVKDYMLSFVNNSEYSADDHRKGSEFIRKLFSVIKGGLINEDENLQSLSVKFLSEYIGVDDGELKELENKLNRGKMS